MKALVDWQGRQYEINLDAPLDISLPLRPGIQNVNCFYAPPFEAIPLQEGDFIGDTRKGSPVNFFNVKINPHGNGTHTECVGHITRERRSINASLQKFHYFARVVSVTPYSQENGDLVIKRSHFEDANYNPFPPALIIRTLPNEPGKKAKNYSGSNPPYFHFEAIEYLVNQGVSHLLVDLPSVDKEQDEGKLLAHKAFWNVPGEVRSKATITELVYVPSEIEDGMYFLNLQIAPFELDATPSKPVLYMIREVE
ncbi:MAG: cyclase family protein [Saprospiraceae bacterium]|nr:cyclase family protein [Saprospiraceae bacterium]